MTKKIVPKTKNDNETIGYRIKVIRTSMGLNQKEFAELLDTYQVKISHIESNILQPNLNIIKKLAAMGYDMNWLLNGEPSPQIAEYVSTNIEIMKIATVLEKLDINQLKFISNFIDLYLNSLKGGKNL